MKKEFKQSLSYNISVEGEVCEDKYFEHLSELINNCATSKYNVKFFIKKKNPKSFAKSRINLYNQKPKKDEGEIKYIHIQDIENYYDSYQLDKFKNLIDEINETKRECKIRSYELGYTNYTFDLWIALHKVNLLTPVSDRYQYYKYINQGYNKNYLHMDDYKSEDEFDSILKQIELVDVIAAIERGKKIRKAHEDNHEHRESYGKFEFYRDNPDLNIHLIIESILKDCEIIK